jgi:hypothetical protein
MLAASDVAVLPTLPPGGDEDSREANLFSAEISIPISAPAARKIRVNGRNSLQPESDLGPVKS